VSSSAIMSIQNVVKISQLRRILKVEHTDIQAETRTHRYIDNLANCQAYFLPLKYIGTVG
jgi:hypothetical protein